MKTSAPRYLVTYPSGRRFQTTGRFALIGEYATIDLGPDQVLVLDPRALVVKQHPDRGESVVYDGRAVVLP